MNNCVDFGPSDFDTLTAVSHTAVDGAQVFLQEDVEARVNNCVDFGPNIGFLRVEAQASTDSRPLPGFEPRYN